ncbi:glutathione-dependent formaldehyde-activating [Cercophora newfieldiana]|uniref:Glutathione-dependent formaldehyde-activating n=1 Tax=Cercophora newfieldiana TaxID=92897 RepID=A0AA39YRD6_9PEZI|nr:glutathione-dependent formaldehyde-activating [Cercophora newfieldiana]
MDASCQCGAVAFKTPLPKPLALYICHCSECRRQTSSAFGTSAIFPKFEIPDTTLLSCYTRSTSNGQTLNCYFCKQCGTRLIHATPGKNVVSVKGGCIDGLDWKAAIHIWTKSAMVPIPEGSETHSEESDFTDYGSTQEVLDQPVDLRGSGGDATLEPSSGASGSVFNPYHDIPI